MLTLCMRPNPATRLGSRGRKRVWIALRLRPLRLFARFVFPRRLNRNYFRSKLHAAPIVSATALESNSKDMTRNFSELSNGPLPQSLSLKELIGSGTFGEVYRATDGETGKEVAVKVVSKKRQGNDVASIQLVRQRIEHEVSMWCELQTFESAVRLEKFYEDEGSVYLVQELCDGGSLEDLMKVRGTLSEVEVAQVMNTVLSLLSHCHERDICYCDVKPANFILPSSVPGLNDPTEYVKVIDFGSCEHVPKSGLRGEKGTPLYMAPEVQNSRYNVESDVWSAGVLMYYLLSGEFPFIGTLNKGLSPSALSFYLQFGELKFKSAVWDRITDEAKDLITNMLERKVKKRMTAKEALCHPWMRRLVPSRQTLSDICPIDSSVRMLEQQL